VNDGFADAHNALDSRHDAFQPIDYRNEARCKLVDAVDRDVEALQRRVEVRR
jgi:hypothetical protein